MLPEQIPGILFVVLTALVGLALGNWPAVLILALGCAAGWLSFHPEPVVKTFTTLLALALWAIGFVLVFIGAL